MCIRDRHPPKKKKGKDSYNLFLAHKVLIPAMAPPPYNPRAFAYTELQKVLAEFVGTFLFAFVWAFSSLSNSAGFAIGVALMVRACLLHLAALIVCTPY